MRRGWTLALTFGDWGGFYFTRGYSLRLCIGWFALTWFPRDLDALFDDLAPLLPKEKPCPTAT